MKNYYEANDRVAISCDEQKLHKELLPMYSDYSGRQKIINDIICTKGRVKATKPNERHLEVLYVKEGAENSWWLPTSLIIFTL